MLWTTTAPAAAPSTADQNASGAAAADGNVPEVKVTGQREPGAEGSAESGYRNTSGWAGPLGQTNLKDVPYSLNVTSGELIESTQAHSMADALKTNPTVYVPQSQLTDTRGMNDAFIRGFKVSYLRNGLYTNSYNMPSIENIERMEVLNGPSAFLYGYVNPGGTINYVTKKPVTEPLVSVKTGTYAGGQMFGAADLGGTIPGTDDQLAFRLNAFGSDGGTFVDKQRLSSNLLTADVDYHITPDTVLKPHFYHTEFRQRGAQAQFLLGTGAVIPATPDPSKLYGQSWALNEVVSNQAGLGLESQLNETFKLRVDYNYSDMLWTDQMIKSTLSGNSGNYTEQFRYFGPQHYYTHTGYALIDASFDTFGIHHDLTFGYWGSNEQDDDAASSQQTLGTSNLASPISVTRPNIDTADDYVSHIEWYYNSFLMGDRITVTDAWSVLVGFNHTRVHELYQDLTSNTVTEQFDDAKTSPSFALIYKPIPQVSAYVSYIEGLEFGNQAPDTAANAKQILAPSSSRQYEGGVKATLGKIDLSAALFQIDKVNAEVDPNDNVYKQDGREIHRGFELTATGKVIDRLTLVGGFTILDASVDKASANPLTEGKIPVGVPEKVARAYAEYEIPGVEHLFVGGGANYLGRRPVDAYNSQYLEGVVTFDAGLRYEPEIFGHKTSLNLKLNNILDERYWVSYTSRNGLQFGEPMTVAFSAKLKW